MASRSDDPPFEDDGVTVLQENVLRLLEEAGVPTEINDKIMALIWNHERAKSSEEEIDTTFSLSDFVKRMPLPSRDIRELQSEGFADEWQFGDPENVRKLTEWLTYQNRRSDQCF